jgi:hypothetical protein
MILALTVSVKLADAQITYVWNGGTSGSWNVASNWKVNGNTAVIYPGSVLSNDIVQVTTNNATITYTGNLTVGQLQTVGYGVAGLVIQFGNTGSTLAITNGLTAAQPNGAAVGISFTGGGTATIGGTSSFSYQASMTIGTGTTVSFTSGSTLDFTQNQGVLTNNGTLNLTGCNFKISSNSSLVSPGTIIGNNSTFNIVGTPAFITYAGKFVANSCTFNLPSHGYMASTSTSSKFTAATCTFNLTGSGGAAYVYSNGTYTDHGSTYNLTGQGAYIQNAADTSLTMALRGVSIGFGVTGGNSAQNITNSGKLTIDSGSTINAAAYQSFIKNTGVFHAGTSGSSCVITLSGQGAAITNTNSFDLGSTSIIYPSGYQATVTNTSPGVFTLRSDVNGTAAIGALSLTATCNGTFNVERYYQGSTTYDNVKKRWLGRNYRIISSAVNTGTQVNGNYIYSLSYIAGNTAGQTTAANSTTNAFITGCAGASTSAGNPSTYLYNQNNTPSNLTFTSGNFIGITNITSASSIGTSAGSGYTIPVGSGVLFFFRGAATNWATRTVAPYIAPENVTLTATGNINQQSVTAKDWYTPSSSNLAITTTSGNSSVRGFNMVGNPYPCTIDWNTINTGGISTTNINPTIYEFNPITNQYDTYISTGASTGTATGSGSSKIASGQGFFVQANYNVTTASPSLTFNETAKAATSQLTGSNLLMGAPLAQAPTQLLRLKLVIDSLNYDDIAIAFNSSASANYNGAEDSQYLPGINAMEGLSSFSSDNVQLSINSLPLPTGPAAQVIKLNVTGMMTGIYTLQRTQLDAIPQIYQVWLMDKYKKDSLDMRNNATYAFNIDLKDTASFGANRFTLVIRQDPALAVHLLNFTATKAAGGAQTVWTTENEQNYTNFTLERSTDNGVTFAVIGGFNSTGLGTYTLLDKSPVNGVNLYRLRIEDLNSVITYSNAVALNYGAANTQANNISVYPNPSSSTINLAISQAVGSSNYISSLQKGASLQSFSTTATTSNATMYAIKIISGATGSVIKTATSASPQWQANVGELVPGTYIIQVTNNSDNSLVGKGTFIKM